MIEHLILSSFVSNRLSLAKLEDELSSYYQKTFQENVDELKAKAKCLSETKGVPYIDVLNYLIAEQLKG